MCGASLGEQKIVMFCEFFTMSNSIDTKVIIGNDM
jgi:hypothetical protein